MALYYNPEKLNEAGYSGSSAFGPVQRDHGVRPTRTGAVLESAAIGAVTGALVSVYWIVGNATAVVPTVLAFSLMFALAALAIRLVSRKPDVD